MLKECLDSLSRGFKWRAEQIRRVALATVFSQTLVAFTFGSFPSIIDHSFRCI